MMSVRTSLDRVPSSFTAEQLAGRQAEFERELWDKYRVVVVRLREQAGLPRLVTMALEAWAQSRWGKSKAA
jgi:hypothetical protein